MSPERRAFLSTGTPAGNRLSVEEKRAGFHYCPEWSYALISPEDWEIGACLCDLESYREEAA